MSKIAEGTRVKAMHDPERDDSYLASTRRERKAHDGETGRIVEASTIHGCFRVQFNSGEAWYDLAELTPVETATAEPSDRVKAITRAAEEIERELQALRIADRERLEALRTWRDRATAAESEAKLVRADLEALQAAVRGLTGKDGSAAEMVADLADVGRSNDVATVAALRRDRDDALRREARTVDALVTARETYEALRAEVQSGGRSWIAAHPGWERLGRALRGEKAPQEPESKPVHVAGPWIEITPGEWRRRVEGSPLLFAASIGPHPDDPRLLVWCAWRPGGGMFAERNTAPDLQAAKDACDVALVRVGWGLASVEAGSIEDRLAEVEAMIGSMSDHLAALDQRVAGLGNAMDEVRDPAWFAARFREHMAPKPSVARHLVASAGDTEGVAALAGLGAPSVAVDPPRVSWRWADGKTSGWLTTAAGEQIAGAHEGNGGWYWSAPQTGNVGPMTDRAAIESAEAAARIQGAVVVR